MTDKRLLNKEERMDNVVDTDVLIVGAGLAGSVLAYRLRQHGLRVTLAERGRLETLDKLCAGALDESVEKLFDGVYGRPYHGQ